MRFHIGHDSKEGTGIVYCSQLMGDILVYNNEGPVNPIGDLTFNEEFRLYARLGEHSKWFPCNILAYGVIDVDFNGFEIYDC